MYLLLLSFFTSSAYDPADYEHLPVSQEIKELFQYITRYVLFLQCHLSLTFLRDFSTQKIRVVAKRQLQNSLTEKEWIAGWILVGDHLVKNNERLLG